MMITILCQYFALIMMVVLMMVVAEEWLQIMMSEIYLYNLDLILGRWNLMMIKTS